MNTFNHLPDDEPAQDDFMTNLQQEIKDNWLFHEIVNSPGQGLTTVRRPQYDKLSYFSAIITMPFYHAQLGLQQLQELEQWMIYTFTVQECQKNLYYTIIQGLIEVRSQVIKKTDPNDMHS